MYKPTHEDNCRRALLNKTYPDDLILEAFEGLDGYEVAEYMIQEHPVELARNLAQNKELQEIFELMAINDYTFANNYFNEFLERWIKALEAA